MIWRRRPQWGRAVLVGLLAYSAALALAWMASIRVFSALSVLSILHWENALYDARVASRARTPGPLPIVELAVPEPKGDRHLTVRPLLVRALPMLRRAGVAAIGVDFLLSDRRDDARGTDLELAARLEGDDAVLASMLDDAGQFQRPHKAFRYRSLTEGMINFEKGSDWDRAVRGTTLWSWRESPGEPVPSMAVALAIVARTREALGETGVDASWTSPAVSAARPPAHTRESRPLREALVQAIRAVTARAAASGEDLGPAGASGIVAARQREVLAGVLAALQRLVAAPARDLADSGGTLPGPLVARLEAQVLLRHLGLSGPLTALVLFHARSFLARDFLGVSLAPVIDASPRSLQRPARLVIDYPRAREGGASLPVLPLAQVALPPDDPRSPASDREVGPGTHGGPIRIRAPGRGDGRCFCRVVDPEGRPVAGARVLLLSAADPMVQEGVTGADGRVAIDGLVRGPCRHLIQCPLDGGSVWARGPGPTIDASPVALDVVMPARQARLEPGGPERARGDTDGPGTGSTAPRDSGSPGPERPRAEAPGFVRPSETAAAPAGSRYWMWTSDPPYPSVATDTQGYFRIAGPGSAATLEVTTDGRSARWTEDVGDAAGSAGETEPGAAVQPGGASGPDGVGGSGRLSGESGPSGAGGSGGAGGAQGAAGGHGAKTALDTGEAVHPGTATAQSPRAPSAQDEGAHAWAAIAREDRMTITATRRAGLLEGRVMVRGRPASGLCVRLVPPDEEYGARIEATAPPAALPATSWYARVYAPGVAGDGGAARLDLAPGANAVAWPPPGALPSPAMLLRAKLAPDLAGASVEALGLETGRRTVLTAGPEGDVEIEAPATGERLMLLARRPGGPYGSALPGLDALEGKIVLIGTRLVEDHDQFVTPSDVGTATSTYGVDIHGVVLENVLSGRGIRDWTVATLAREGDWRTVLAILAPLVMCLLVSLAWASLEFTPALVAVTLLGVAHRQAAWWLLAEKGVWVDVAVPWLAFFLTSTHWLQHHYRTSYRESQRRKDLFGRFVDPAMVSRILDLDTIDLAGERAVITVLFSDIRGFTTISERTDPREMLRMLNDYFSSMVPILKRNGGTLDKYIGDAVMGFFGAPVASPEHAMQAVTTAVEMLAANHRLKRERGRWFDIGFGINTGDCVTGLVGDRAGAVNYSAIGDAVNLASRLESLNKECHTEILISESTYAGVRDAFETLPMGVVHVKGKVEAVRVYQVLGKKGAAISAPGTPPPDKGEHH